MITRGHVQQFDEFNSTDMVPSGRNTSVSPNGTVQEEHERFYAQTSIICTTLVPIQRIGH